MKYLIVGLGNIGEEYENTRHNIGFTILDALARASNISFSEKRYGSVAEMKHAGKVFILLKPNTFMNLSGRSVHYWMQKEGVELLIGTSIHALFNRGFVIIRQFNTCDFCYHSAVQYIRFLLSFGLKPLFLCKYPPQV